MPSAANIKVEKQTSNEGTSISEAGSTVLSPLRQIITLMEHKIRNLEKRKAKLESYRDLKAAGKELNADQITAVAKYGEVMHTLEFAREMCKQCLGITIVSEKEAKKQAKKELAAKSQNEFARLREILLVQDGLNQMGNENVREDFLHGHNGAAQLSEQDLKLLDAIYLVVTPKHEVGNPTAFTNEVQAAAEHLLAIVDGKPKEIFDGTYGQIKEVLGKIHESGYFDQVKVEESVETVENPTESDVQHSNGTPPHLQQVVPPAQGDVMVNESLSLPPQPPSTTQITHQVQQSQLPPPPQPPQQLPPQPEAHLFYQPPPRPIAEMLAETGSFYFLQESEIDTPPDPIPTQTYTNQSFVGGPPPPQSAPTVLPPQMFQPMPPGMQPPMQLGPQQPSMVPPPPSGPPTKLNVDEPPPMKIDNVVHHSKMGGQHRPTNVENNQSYYHHNNGYNPRPRQTRNGPRSGGGHHNPRHNN